MLKRRDPVTDPPNVEPPWRRRAKGAALFGLAIVAGLFVAQTLLSTVRPHAWAGTAFATPLASPALDGLSFDDGTPADLAVFDGEVVIMYFGYTHCPDVCPLTLSTAATAIEDLGDKGDNVQLLMVSVDPERDPLDELGQYVRHFSDDFAGVGGPGEAIASAAALYGIFYEIHEPDQNGFYLVDHTATLIGIDPEGNLKVVWAPDVSSDQLKSDIEELLQ